MRPARLLPLLPLLPLLALAAARVTIDGRPIDEPYLAPGVTTGGVHEVRLGPDQ